MERRTARGDTGPLHVCYLDFDGVTHVHAVYWSPNRGIHVTTPGHTLFEWAPILEQMLKPYPDVKLVLATSWVRARGFEFAKAQLLPALQARVMGATFDNRIVQKLDYDLMPCGLQGCRAAATSSVGSRHSGLRLITMTRAGQRRVATS